MNFINDTTLTAEGFEIVNYLPEIGIESVHKELLSGLNSSPKMISPKYFYDQMGSDLFERITNLKEYYPTRTEKSILKNLAQAMQFDFQNTSIIELGSGDNSKIRLLLSSIDESLLSTLTYIPVDISQPALEKSAKGLLNYFPTIRINGVVADFLHQLNIVPRERRRLFCFFGSTIGNFNKEERKSFLKLLGAEMQTGDSLLLGMDMVKDIHILEKAYNDDLGVTAAFNRNILQVVNILIKSNFNPDMFQHKAYFNREESRIEMHLEASDDMQINFPDKKHSIVIRRGERIHTENSHKFIPEQFNTFGLWAGLELQDVFMDEKNWFSLVHYAKL